MQMRNCQHQDVTIVEGVDQPVRESAEAAAANPFARGLCSIPVNGLVELDLGNLKKPNRHGRYLATMLLRSLAESSPRR